MSGPLVRRAVILSSLLFLHFALLSPAYADRWYAPEPYIGAVDSGRELGAAHRAGVGWDRVVFLWQEIQPSGPDDWRLDEYIDWAGLEPTLESGIPLFAVVQGTPTWAAGNPADGPAAVPTGLDYPIDDPQNTFGRFMTRLTESLGGRVDAWIVWNEPDFAPGDAGDWWTWVGNTEDLFKVVRTGYRAVKAADPTATVVFPATAYYPDAVHGRELFLSRVLREAASDPDAGEHGYYFDALAVNLYCSVAIIHHVYALYLDILAEHGLQKPIWLTETNCQVYNDAASLLDPHLRISTNEQAAYLLQSLAMARATGYQRIGWYAMVDHDASAIIDRYGLVRQDGTTRPAYRTFQLATDLLNRPGVARFLPHQTSTDGDDWDVWRVVFDDYSQDRRVHIMWAGEQGPRSVRVPARGYDARLFDVLGRRYPIQLTSGWWTVELPPARVLRSNDPLGFPAFGDPVVLVEDGIAVGTPVGPIVTGPPPSVERFFADTGYVVEDDRIWRYFLRMGGNQSLGAPISYDFPFLGGTVQLFENAAVFLPRGESPRLLDLAGGEFLPFTRLAPDVQLPLLGTGDLVDALVSGSGEETLRALRPAISDAVAPHYFRTMTCTGPSEPRCSMGYIPEQAIERYGLPLSDVVAGGPERRQFQRFERGVLWSDGQRTGELPLGSLFKKVLLGHHLPLELERQARESRFYRQYDADQPVARPNHLPGTDLRHAF